MTVSLHLYIASRFDNIALSRRLKMTVSLHLYLTVSENFVEIRQSHPPPQEVLIFVEITTMDAVLYYDG